MATAHKCVEENRVKWVMVRSVDVYDWFTFALKREITYGVVSIPWVVGDKFPTDTILVDMREFPYRKCFGFLVAHQSFDRVPLGREIPVESDCVPFGYARYDVIEPGSQKQAIEDELNKVKGSFETFPDSPKPEPVPPVLAGLPVYANEDGSLFSYNHKTGVKTPISQTIEFLVHHEHHETA
jgi:hypothetical protein